MTAHALDDPIVAMAADRIARGSKSFALAARLFVPQTRASAFMLYAWCRHCDDEIDGQVLGYGRQAARAAPAAVLAELRERTIAATQGKATEPIYIGLQRVLHAHAIPAVHPLDLIRGMEMDVEMEAGARRYGDLDALLAYCYHVAGVVGVMMAMVMGVRPDQRDVLLRASDLGIAFQLTNIVRDVVVDAAAGRVYLPADLLRTHGLDAETLASTPNRPALHAATLELLEVAELYYRSAEAGLRHLPFRAAWAVAAARRVYRDIGTDVTRRGSRAWDTRTSTGTARKLTGVALASFDAARSRFGGEARERTGLWTPPSLALGTPKNR